MLVVAFIFFVDRCTTSDKTDLNEVVVVHRIHNIVSGAGSETSYADSVDLQIILTRNRSETSETSPLSEMPYLL